MFSGRGQISSTPERASLTPGLLYYYTVAEGDVGHGLGYVKLLTRILLRYQWLGNKSKEKHHAILCEYYFDLLKVNVQLLSGVLESCSEIRSDE